MFGLPGMDGQVVPGFAGGMFRMGSTVPLPQAAPPMAPQMPQGMNQPDFLGQEAQGIQNAFADNQRLQAERPKGGLFKEGGTLRNVLGILGDSLLVANGMAPIYAPAQQQRKAEERRAASARALANYLGNGDAALAELAAGGLDPDDIVSVYNAKNKRPELPGAINEAVAYAGLDPQTRAMVDQYLPKRYPGMVAPITMGPNDTIEMPGQQAGGDLPVVSSPEEARQLPPGTRFRRPDGMIGTVPGGPTQPASVPFP